MRNYLIAGIITLFVGTAIAGIPPASQPGGSADASYVAGMDITGDDGVFKTLQSTGTAPSLTATGGVFTGSVTLTGSNGLSVGGNLGIGTASPASKLHVSSGTIHVDGNTPTIIIDRTNAADAAVNGNMLELKGADAGQYGLLRFYRGTNDMGRFGYGNAASVLSGADDYSMILRAENSLHLAASGNNLTMTMKNGKVGIGTASPASKLDVAGDAQFGSGVNKSTITAGGFWMPLSQTTLQASLLAPTAASGQYIHNSTINELCKSTGTSAGNWQKVDGGGGCF